MKSIDHKCYSLCIFISLILLFFILHKRIEQKRVKTSIGKDDSEVPFSSIRFSQRRSKSEIIVEPPQQHQEIEILERLKAKKPDEQGQVKNKKRRPPIEPVIPSIIDTIKQEQVEEKSPQGPIANTSKFNDSPFSVEQRPQLNLASQHLKTKKVKKQLSLNRFESLTFEGEPMCTEANEASCHHTNKSLILTYWRDESKQRWLANNLLKTFPEDSFDYVIMVHDDSNWHDHQLYDKAVWIHVQNQIRFWYLKRFLTPHVLSAYRYIWIVEDDARLTFNPLQYQCVVDKIGIPFSAPSRVGGAIVHRITKQSKKYLKYIGRWTDFVEIGPMIIGTSAAWVCVWKYLNAAGGTGYGLDNIWCRILAQKCFTPGIDSKVCAILDIFGYYHDSNKIRSHTDGRKEFSAYQQFKNYSARAKTIGPLATNLNTYEQCLLQT